MGEIAMATGRRPDYDVVVVTQFKGAGNKGKFKNAYTRVGAAWLNDSGSISFSIVTMPDVKFRLFENKEKNDASTDTTTGDEDDIGPHEPF